MSEQAAHILIVEDEETHAELVCRAFGSQPRYAERFLLTVVPTLAQARAFLAASRPDLIIADLRLPDGQGIDLLSDGGGPPAFPLVVMTSFGDELVAVEAIKGGALDYVVKSAMTLSNMPRIAESALREWGHMVQRQQVEEALRESEERYRTVADFAYDWEYWMAPDGKFIYVSPACVRVTGYRVEEFMDDPNLLERIIHPDDQERIVNHFHEGEEEKKLTHELEFRIITRNGEERWIGHHCQPVKGREGVYLGRRGSNHDITERKRAEKDLRTSEERFRSVAQSANDVIIVADSGGAISLWNKSAQIIFGYTEEEAMGKSVTILMPERYRQAHREGMARFIRTGESRVVGNVVELIGMKKDGSELPVELSLSTWSVGEGTFFTGIIRDLTERKRTEEVTERLNRQILSILESAGEGIFGLDLEGKHTFVNPAAAQMLGYEVEELIGQGSHPAWHYAHADGAPYPFEQCPIYETLRDGKVHQGQEFFWRKDGTGFPVDYTSTPMHVEDKTVGAVVTFTDITERNRAEETLRESEEKYRLLVQNAQDAIYIVQEEKLPFANPMTETITGYSTGELAKIPFVDLIHPGNRAMVLDRCRRRVKGEDLPSTYPFKIIRKDGKEREVMLNTVPISWEGRPATLNFLRDITELRLMEGQLRQAQKMEAIGTLAGGIAHDFNNTLGAIFGYTEMALIKVPSDNEVRDYLEGILNASERAKDLVKQILTFSRQTNSELRLLRVGSVLKEVMKLLRPSLPTFIEIRQEIATDKDIILADSTQIHQVLINLCTNAGHAMRKKGGVLEIGLRNVEFGLGNEKSEDGGWRSNLSNLDLSPGSYVELTVSDSGHGIEERFLSRIFDPYFTTKRIGEGTGLGLAVVHGIVKSHGGAIQVESCVGKGTTFRIYFPRPEEVEKPFETEAPSAIISGKGKILLVDDEAVMVKVG